MTRHITVIAGTPVDTRMGVELVEAAGAAGIYVPLSRTPHEQNAMQYLEREELQQAFEAKVREGMAAGGDAVFLYCNSLSTAVDYRSSAERLGVQIVTPLDIYDRWAAQYSRLAIIAANSQSASGIEARMRAANPDLEVVSLGMLPLVEAIERGESPSHIIKAFHLEELLNWCESLAAPFGPPQGLILGCTHFPYLKDALAEYTNLLLLDPAAHMLAQIGL